MIFASKLYSILTCSIIFWGFLLHNLINKIDDLSKFLFYFDTLYTDFKAIALIVIYFTTSKFFYKQSGRQSKFRVFPQKNIKLEFPKEIEASRMLKEENAKFQE